MASPFALSGGGGAVATLAGIATAPATLVVGAAAVGVGLGTGIRQIPGVDETATGLLEKAFDSTIFLTENNRHRRTVASGLIGAARKELAKIGAAGGPGKDPDLRGHRKDIKAFLSRAKAVVRRLPKKTRKEFLKQIKEIADGAGVRL